MYIRRPPKALINRLGGRSGLKDVPGQSGTVRPVPRPRNPNLPGVILQQHAVSTVECPLPFPKFPKPSVFPQRQVTVFTPDPKPPFAIQIQPGDAAAGQFR